MSDNPFRPRPTLRQKWVRRQYRRFTPEEGWLRAGVAGAYLPRLLLDVPHQPQARVAEAVPQCASMVLRYHGAELGAEELACLLRRNDLHGTQGRRLEWLRGWGVRCDCPRDLQFFRDGTIDLNRSLHAGETRLVFQWEERWLRYVTRALEDGLPPILFVDLGRLYPQWRGVRQPHAVVLCGGDGRRAWINDPARSAGPVRVGLATLMDALLPGEPLAAVLSPGSKVRGPRSGVREPRL
jgi:hypothetical protein